MLRRFPLVRMTFGFVSVTVSLIFIAAPRSA